MSTDLKNDSDYLLQLLRHAARLWDTNPKKMPEAAWKENIIEYFLYLTLDGIDDYELARSLDETFNAPLLEAMRLAAWAEAKNQDSDISFLWHILWTLRKLLLLRHQIAHPPEETVSRADFMKRWKSTANNLRL